MAHLILYAGRCGLDRFGYGPNTPASQASAQSVTPTVSPELEANYLLISFIDDQTPRICITIRLE